MQNEFSGHVIVVTGATAGVGRAISTLFARHGAKLGLISRDLTALEMLRKDINGECGSTAAIAALDVSNSQSVFHAAEQFARELGPIDIWINDAMLTVFSPVAELTPEEFRRVTEVTYLGVVYGSMAALRQMRPRRSGQIINIGSALAYRGIPLQSAYCGAKHAIRGFTSSLRAELDHEGCDISLSILELPAMNTPQFDWARTHMPRQPKPMGTIYEPEAAARAVLRAARTRAREYWVGTSTLMTIVGNMVAPEFMDWFLARTAIRGQQTNNNVQRDRRDNLFEPVTELHRTRGSFSARARQYAYAFPGALTRAAIVAIGAAAFFLLGRGTAARARKSRQ
ncbi:MAG TPA: SDR family oxidoreductase [Rhizomicrobium sp.]|nr:SDR family oxidoreductase [Rhizomicrobium sp.]